MTTLRRPVFRNRTLRSRLFTATALAAALAVMAGCGERKAEKPASQTAAKVNKDEITVHQINHVLQAQRGLKPEQAEAAGRQMLERLIDQQLALQKAEELKIDRDPRVVQQLEAARREVIARAYAERVGESAAKPTPEDVRQYFDTHPALFKERKVYTLQEIAIQAPADKLESVGARLQAAKSVGEFVEQLKAGGYKVSSSQVVRAAEQLPLASIDQLARMKDGEAALVPSQTGASVVVVASARPEPLTLEQASPVIEAFLVNDRRRKAVETDLKALRAAAKIEYVGKFAEKAPAPAERQAAAQVTPAAPANPAAGALSAADIQKGMGFK